ncbi:hypothetical protein ACWDYJ_06120 [Streptomyces sp. NPDC003042]
MTGLRVLQIPETCGWNDYVALQESHLAAQGAVVLRPGLCRDEPGFAPGDLSHLFGAVPDIVHLHWPEMLARLLGDAEAVALLRKFAARGACLVRTVHDLAPHEEGAHGNAGFIDEVDSLTHGVHFFTKEHELAARRIRSRLPGPALHLPHPRYPLRGGSPEGSGPARELPGSRSGLEQVDWVALPYQRVWSSGVLVAAAQQGRRILSPPPVGWDAYGPALDDWQIVEPWDDDVAVLRWQEALTVPPEGQRRVSGPGSLALPQWDAAADALGEFYHRILAA